VRPFFLIGLTGFRPLIFSIIKFVIIAILDSKRKQPMKKLILFYLLSTICISGFGQIAEQNAKRQHSGMTQVLYFTTRGIPGNVHLVVLDDAPPLILDFTPADMTRPYGIAADTIHGKVYITDYTNQAIYRYNADGTNGHKILDANVPGQEIVGDAEAIFVLGDKIYWGRTGGIYRADLDGANPELFIAMNGGTEPDFPIDMQYDPATNKIYFVNDKTDFLGGFWSVNFDGTDFTEITFDAPGTSDVDGTALEMDFRTGKAYLVLYGSAGTVAPESGVFMCNLNGTAFTRIGDVGIKVTWGIALDQTRNKLFWGYKMSNSAPDGKIIRANLDGSGPEDWITGVSPHAMTVAWINLWPVGTPENKKLAIKVYPIPAGNNLNITGDFANAAIFLNSADGRLVFASKGINGETTIDLTSFKCGFYILRIETSDGVISRKVSIIH
jgi:hypothetical protein